MNADKTKAAFVESVTFFVKNNELDEACKYKNPKIFSVQLQNGKDRWKLNLQKSGDVWLIFHDTITSITFDASFISFFVKKMHSVVVSS